MVWTISVCFLVGMLIGSRYAVPALLVASFLTAAAVIAAGAASGWTLGRTTLEGLCLLAAIQGGYLAALSGPYLVARIHSGAKSPGKNVAPEL